MKKTTTKSKFKKGQKVRMALHGAGVTSYTNEVVERVSKGQVWLEETEIPLDAVTGQSEVDFFGFWREIQ